MNLRKYILDNYQKEISDELPLSLKFLLDSFNANHINLENFKKQFSLNEASYLQILKFISI